MSNNLRPVPPSFGHKALTAFLSASLCLSLTPAQAFAADDVTADATAATREASAQTAPESTTATPSSTASDTPAAEATEKPSEAAAPVSAAPAPAASTVPTASRLAAPAPKSLANVYVDGATGNDDTATGAVDAPFKTFEAALKAMSDGGTVHVKGSFALANPVTIPAKATLDIYGDTTLTGAGKNGFTLSKEATLKASNGAKLSMSGFNTALTAQAGSLITDGVYNFKNNASTNSTTGISLGGTVKGSTGRDKLVITADDKSETNFYTAAAVFENCTVNVTSQNKDRISWTLSGSWIDGKLLTLKNANFTVAGINGGFYIKPSFTDSHFTVAVGPQGAQRTGATIQSTGTISGSTVSINGGYEAGLSVGITDGPLTITNSTLEFKNGGTGGFNVNTGKVTLENSTIKGDGKNSGALYGAQAKGSITFTGSSRVETPATAKSHTGAAQAGGSHVVLGGSYHVSYVPNYNGSMGSTVPTNGAENGNEKLMLFTLTDSSIPSFSPINSNGQAYAYPVATPSEDGKKHVWVPAEKVTFVLNEPGTQNAVSASFEDGTTDGKEALAMRGYSLADATPAAGANTAPADPTAIGYDFAGWFYKEGNTEEPFDASAVNITSPTTVYAKWKENANSYGVVYHNNAGGTDVTYTDKGKNADRTAQVVTHEAVSSANAAFAPKGKIFKGWNTKADGQGQSYAPNQTITVPAGKPSLDLYAQWEDQMAAVRFSANGGIFSNDSVFKKNPDVFEISKDDQGGEVATVKAQAKILDQKSLDDLLKSLKADVTTATDGLASPVKDSASDKAFAKIATKNHSVLDYKNREEGLWFTTTYHDYWYTDADGKNATTLKSTTKVNNDITYYLKWKTDPSIEVVKHDFNLSGDIYSEDFKASVDARFVNAENESFSLTGQIDAKAIQNQMQGIQALYPSISEADYKNIKLDDTTSTFTAKITLPEGVQIPYNPTITAKGLGNAFTVESTEANGQTITVTFKLVNGINNYQALKDAVDSTGKDDAAQTTETGVCPISVTVEGLTLDSAKVNNNQELVATGTVEGTFSAIASVPSGKAKKFDFSWKATQSAAGKDKNAKDNDTIQHTIIAVKPTEQTIPADLLINGDSTHESVYGVLPGQKIAVTGAVNVKSIKDQMAAIEALYPNTPHNQIDVTVKDFNFSAKLMLPAGMTMPKDLTPDALELKDFGGFKVTKVEVKDNVATVSMALSDSITKYDQLEKAVDSAGGQDGWMKVTIPDVLVNSDVAEGTSLTTTAEVSGSFDALATYNGKTKPFSFIWTGEQWADGKDSVASDPQVIQATVQTPSTMKATLPADILVGDNTEHNEIYTTTAGSKVDYTGALNVNAIKAQMSAIERLYPGVDQSQIMVDVADCTFTATFEVPDGITLPSNVSVTTNSFGTSFRVTNVKTEGNKVTVTMKLDEGVTKYTDLQNAVAQAGDADGWMKLTLHGLTVNSDVTPGTQLRVVGTITGTMKATATSGSGHSKAFSFAWTGEQWADGKDATTDASDTSISFTLTVKATDNPNNPNQPSKPNTNKPQVKPQDKTKKVLPKTGDAMGMGALAGMAAAGLAALGVRFGIRRKNDEE